MYKCIKIETSNDHSPSDILYYNKKNDDNIEEKSEICHFGNQNSFPYNDDLTHIDLSLNCIGEDESNESTFRTP